MFGVPRNPNRPFTWVTDQLAVGKAPLSVAHIALLHDAGIHAILNLCGEFSDLHDIEREHGFEVYYLPVQDEEAPEMQELEKGLAWLDEALYLGKKVLIHCRHGVGRTGTVLNAYLLRRGLGHRGAARILRGLASQPTNFTQWRTVRRYGKANAPLSVREPSLESGAAVDLTPFFEDYERLVGRAEDLYATAPNAGRDLPRCGREHERCSSVPVRVPLIEAAYLAAQIIGRALTSRERQAAIERAVASARQERALARGLCAPDAEECCLIDAGSTCPLLVDGRCQVFEFRPLQCRTWDLDEAVKAEAWETVFAPGLADLSDQVFFAFTSEPVARALPSFSLSDVVSGRYVQAFFHFLMQ